MKDYKDVWAEAYYAALDDGYTSYEAEHIADDAVTEEEAYDGCPQTDYALSDAELHFLHGKGSS